MFRFERFSKFVSELSIGVKVIAIAITLIGLLSGAVVTGKSMIAVPKQLAMHDSTERSAQADQTKILQKMVQIDERQLCMAIADHRKQDWTLCYTNPAVVMPDGTLDAH